MNGFTIDLAELERCQKIIQDLAGEFGGVSDEFAVGDVDNSLFGALPAGAGLARVVKDIHAAAGDHLLAAHEFLHDVGQRLSDARQRLSSTEDSNAALMSAFDEGEVSQWRPNGRWPVFEPERG